MKKAELLIKHRKTRLRVLGVKLVKETKLFREL